MANPKCEIRIYKKTSESEWSSNYTSIYVASLDIAENIEVRRDMFKLSFYLTKSINPSIFAIDDLVYIYLYYGSSPTTQDLAFSGLVVELEMSVTSNGKIISVTGANRTHDLLSSLVLINFADNSKKVYEVIQEIINQVNNNNQAVSPTHPRHIYYDNTTLKTTKRDGSNFPYKNFLANYKTAYDAIQQFSADEYTEDGQYIFWIDHQNRFYWTYKSLSVPSGYLFEEGKNVERITIQKGVWDVVNCVIVDVGKDCYNNGNHILQINPVSALQSGAKWKFLDKSTISPTLIDEQWKKDKTKWNNDTGSDGILIRKSSFPNSYPFTMSFNYIDDNYVEANYKWVVADNAQFNFAIRKRSKYEGKKVARGYLEAKQAQTYKAMVDTKGTLDFDKGELCGISSSSFNLYIEQIRIKEVKHSFGRSGWITTLSLEEDSE